MAGLRKIGTPEGLLLFDRGTGLNILLDELKGRCRWEKPLHGSNDSVERERFAQKIGYAQLAGLLF